MIDQVGNEISASRMPCPKCGAVRAYRKTRKSFLQKQVMGFFNLYPWECGSCHHRYYSKNRGDRRRERPTENPWTPTGPRQPPAA